jgi:light-regulated signal transduction histidine kinase (bacteriophytochrome)
LIEDNPGDARLIKEMLTEAKSAPFQLEWHDQLNAGLQRLTENGADIVLLDLGLPDSQGLDTYAAVHAQFPRLPIVVLSGLHDESMALKAVRDGAQDYLVKGQIDGKLMARSISYAIERKNAEEALREAHDNLEQRVKERTLELSNLNNQLKEEIEIRKRAEELKELTNALKVTNTDLMNFTHVISHDLKSPLHTIGGFANLLARRYKGKIDAGADEILDDIVKGVNRMQELIKGLLEYSQARTKKKQFKPIASTSVVKKAVSNLEAVIKANNAVVTYDELPTIMADPLQLISLFQNLIDNAIKYRKEEGPRIHVSAQQKGNEWIFSIKDNGIGIDSKGSERIFGMFQRLSNDQSGTGIGLATCKEIVKRHGGLIWVESNPGKGSTFFFTIAAENAQRVTSDLEVGQ